MVVFGDAGGGFGLVVVVGAGLGFVVVSAGSGFVVGGAGVGFVVGAGVGFVVVGASSGFVVVPGGRDDDVGGMTGGGAGGAASFSGVSGLSTTPLADFVKPGLMPAGQLTTAGATWFSVTVRAV